MRNGGIFNEKSALGIGSLGESVGFFCTPGLDPYYCKCMREHVGFVDSASLPGAISNWSSFCKKEADKNKVLSSAISSASKVTVSSGEKAKEPVIAPGLKFGGGKPPTQSSSSSAPPGAGSSAAVYALVAAAAVVVAGVIVFRSR